MIFCGMKLLTPALTSMAVEVGVWMRYNIPPFYVNIITYSTPDASLADIWAPSQ